MAYDRAAPNKTKIAYLLKEDNQDENVRQLVDALAKILNKNAATIQSDSVSTLVTALGSAGV
jgi:hypothetical protein